MVTYVKKTMFGLKEIQVPTDVSTDDYVVISVTEYNNMIKQINDLKKTIELQKCSLVHMEERAENDLYEAEAEFEKRMEVIQTTYKDQLDKKGRENAEMQKKLLEAENEADEARLLNENLLRISRERANGDRGIQPKKEHDGYVVLRSEQWTDNIKIQRPEEGYERYAEEFLAEHNLLRTEVRSVDSWKTIIQTPYNTELSFNQVESLIQNDLKHGTLKDIGITVFEAFSDNENHEIDSPAADDSENICYKYRLRADFRSGYWEVDCYTLSAIVVSQIRYPVKKRQI